MIPKVIHYCWFSGEEMSPFIKKCMNTWKEKLPDYKLRLWDANSFDFDSVPFVREAYKAKKWAFVTDYVRLYALYTEGGIYMDTDVKVMKNFDEFLNYNFFTSHEIHPFFYNNSEQKKLDNTFKLIDNNTFIEGFGVQAAIMGSIKGLPYLKDCLNYYNSLTFDLNKYPITNYIIGKHITRNILKYGYCFIDKNQLLTDNMMIFESKYFVGNALYLKEDSYAIHLCNSSWTENANSLTNRIRNNFPLISPLWFFMYKVWKRLFH